MSRFNYVKFDERATGECEFAKKQCEELEKFIGTVLPEGRAKALALTKLEECYMWIGKAIRDSQVARSRPAPEHTPERSKI